MTAKSKEGGVGMTEIILAVFTCTGATVWGIIGGILLALPFLCWLAHLSLRRQANEIEGEKP